MANFIDIPNLTIEVSNIFKEVEIVLLRDFSSPTSPLTTTLSSVTVTEGMLLDSDENFYKIDSYNDNLTMNSELL